MVLTFGKTVAVSLLAATTVLAPIEPSEDSTPIEDAVYLRVPACEGDEGEGTCVTVDDDQWSLVTGASSWPLGECASEDGSGGPTPCIFDPATMGNGVSGIGALYVVNF